MTSNSRIVWGGSGGNFDHDGASEHQNLQFLGISTTADSANPFSAKLNSTLFTASPTSEGGSGDMRTYINKEASWNTGALLLQTNYLSHAQLGLVADDHLGIHVSSDGSNFTRVIHANKDSGAVTIGEGLAPAGDQLYVRKDSAAGTQFTVNNFSASGNPSAAFRLNSTGGHYANCQLYGAGYYYHYSNATMILGTYAPRGLTFRTDSIDRLKVHPDGRISINTNTQTAQLAVNGTIRVGESTVSALPSASTNGSGALIYVSDETGGPTLAYSDGSQWLRIRDDIAVS